MARASKHRLGLVKRWQVPTLGGAVLAAGAWASIQMLMVAQVLNPEVFQPISSLAQLRIEVSPHGLLPSAQELVELPLRQFRISLNAAMPCRHTAIVEASTAVCQCLRCPLAQPHPSLRSSLHPPLRQTGSSCNADCLLHLRLHPVVPYRTRGTHADPPSAKWSAVAPIMPVSSFTILSGIKSPAFEDATER